MQKALHIRTTVQLGGKVEFASPELEAGQTVDVVVRSTNYNIKYRVGRRMTQAHEDNALLRVAGQAGR